MGLDHLNLRVRDIDACRAFYERHFGFRLAFEADGGYFLRDDDRFLLALVPADPHQALPPGFHLGFGQIRADDVSLRHDEMAAAGVDVTAIEDLRPGENYITFRGWDPDGTEVEVYWDG